MTARSKTASDSDATDTERDFRTFVNMTAHRLEAWLKTEESRAVGARDSDGAESTGHASGRHIVALLRKRKSDYDDDDRKEMRRVVGYVKRHLAQRPQGDTSETRWAYSLKNWGHDPEKK